MRTPIDFNDCVSKNELRAILDDKFNEILQQITNLAKRIEDVEQRHPEPCPEDDDDDLFEEDDGDAEVEAKAQRRAEDARNRNRLNFNRHGMGGNNQGNNDPFSKTKFKIPHFSGSADPEAYLDRPQSTSSGIRASGLGSDSCSKTMSVSRGNQELNKL